MDKNVFEVTNIPGQNVVPPSHAAGSAPALRDEMTQTKRQRAEKLTALLYRVLVKYGDQQALPLELAIQGPETEMTSINNNC